MKYFTQTISLNMRLCVLVVITNFQTYFALGYQTKGCVLPNEQNLGTDSSTGEKFNLNIFRRCFNLCWYTKSCSSVTYSPSTSSCSLRTGGFEEEDVVERLGSIANGPMCQAKSHACADRPCQDHEVCVPVQASRAHLCLKDTAIMTSDTTPPPATTTTATSQATTTTTTTTDVSATSDTSTTITDITTATSTTTTTTAATTTPPDTTTSVATTTTTTTAVPSTAVTTTIEPTTVAVTTTTPTTSATTEAIDCPSSKGYTYEASVTLCYKIHSDKKVWSAARPICQDEGADLVVLHDENVKRFIQNKMEDMYPGEDYYVGAHDRDEDGVWMWVDDTPVGSKLGPRRYCSEMSGSQHVYSVCGGTPQNFVCSIT